MKLKKLLGVVLSVAMISSTLVASMSSVSAASVDPLSVEYTTVDIDLSNTSNYGYYDWDDKTNTTRNYQDGVLTLSTNESQVKFLPYINKHMEDGHNWYYVTYTFKSNVHPNQTINGQFGRIYYSNESSGVLINGKVAEEGYANCPSLFQHWLGPEYKPLENVYNTDNWTTIAYYINAGEYFKTGNMQIYSYINGVYKSMIETTAVNDWVKLGDIKFQTDKAMTGSWSFKDIKAGYGDGDWSNKLGFDGGYVPDFSNMSKAANIYNYGNDNSKVTYDPSTGGVTMSTVNSNIKFMTYNHSDDTTHWMKGVEYVPTGYNWYYAGYKFKSNSVSTGNAAEPFMQICNTDPDSGGKRINQCAVRGSEYGGANGLMQIYKTDGYQTWDQHEGSTGEYRISDTISNWHSVEYYAYTGDPSSTTLYLYVDGAPAAVGTLDYNIERIGCFNSYFQNDQTLSISIKDIRFAYGNNKPNTLKSWSEDVAGLEFGSQINLTPGSGQYDFYTYGSNDTTRTLEDDTLTVSTNNSMVKFMTYNRAGKEIVPTGYKYYYASYKFITNTLTQDNAYEPFMAVYGVDADSCADKKVSTSALRGVSYTGENGLLQMYATGSFDAWDKVEGRYADYRIEKTVGVWNTVEYYGVRNDNGTSTLVLFVNGNKVAEKLLSYDIERLGSFKFNSKINETGSVSFKDVRFAYGNECTRDLGIEEPKELDKPEYTGYTELETVQPITLESNLYPNDQFTYKYDVKSKTLAVIRPASTNNTNFQMLGEQKFNGKTYTDYNWYKVSYDAKLESGDINNFGHFGWLQHYNTEGKTTGAVMNTNYANASGVEIRSKDYHTWNQRVTVDHSVWNHYEFWYHRTSGNMEVYFAVNGQMYGPYDTLIASSDFNAMGQLMFGYDHNAGDPVETTLRLANVNYSYGSKSDFEVSTNAGEFVNADDKALDDGSVVTHGEKIKAIVEDAIDSVQIYKVYNNGKGDADGHEVVQIEELPATVDIDTEGLAAVEIQWCDAEGVVESTRVNVTGYAPELFLVNSKGEKIASNSFGGDMGSYYIVDGDDEQIYACYTTVPDGYLGANIYESATSGSMFINDVSWGSYDLNGDFYKVALPTASSTGAAVKRHKIQFIVDTAQDTWSVAIEASYVKSSSVKMDGSALTYKIVTCNNEIFPTQFVAAVYDADGKLLDAKYATSDVEGGVYAVTLTGSVEGGAYVKLFTYAIDTLLKPVHKAYTYMPQ